MTPPLRYRAPFSLGVLGIYGFALFAPLSIAFSQISIGITLLGWIIQIIRQRSIRWQKTPLDLPLLIYCAVQLTAALLSRHMFIGIKVWLNTDWFILFFYAVIHLIEDQKQIRQIILLLAVSGTIAGLYGIVQHFQGIDYMRGMKSLIQYGNFYRAVGFFDLPLTYGGLQLALLWFLLPFYFVKEKWVNKSFFGAVLAVIFLSILASYARSAWLGMGGALILLIFFLEKKYVFTILGAILLGLILIYFLHPVLLFKKGLLSMFDTSDTASYNNLVRLRLWESSLNLIKDHWFLGIGYSDFSEIFDKYKVPFDYGGLSSPHNIFLKITCHSGLLGGLAYCAVWFSFLYAVYRKYKPGFLKSFTPLKAGSIGSFFAVFALLVGGLTQEYYYDQENAELWWFIAAIGIIGIINRKSEPE